MAQDTTQAGHRRLPWRPPEPTQRRILAFPRARRAPRRDGVVSASARHRLDTLRQVARDSCLACRPQCPLRPDSSELCAAAQFRAFLETSDRRISLHRPGAKTVTVDEQWLLRLTAALSDGDVAGASALVAFRVDPIRRRPTLAAARAVAECLDTLASASAALGEGGRGAQAHSASHSMSSREGDPHGRRHHKTGA